MRTHAPHPAKRARIEIIPLIDVIFFLLATFVLVSLSMTRLQGLDMEMPKAVVPPPGTARPEIVTIFVTPGGGLLWNSDPLTMEQLPVRIQKYRRGNPDPKILINGDEAAQFGQAVEVLDTVRSLGISKVAIETKLKKPEQSN